MQTLGDYYRFTDPGYPTYGPKPGMMDDSGMFPQQPMPTVMSKPGMMDDGGMMPQQPMKPRGFTDDSGMQPTLGSMMGRHLGHFRQDEGVGRGGMVPYMNAQRGGYRPYFTNQF